ncbi:hypothetical protein EUX98_g7743 [Antrodiella citrinella]|uniref:Uncharacterized protein n=1 Tax=Antrodiella citrinella TaxID=2447956 RepID=A0A4V3XHR6_9APHY|nr:hypothetical protein EUX98_g7743 [Antrodiella citrinella]
MDFEPAERMAFPPNTEQLDEDADMSEVAATAPHERQNATAAPELTAEEDQDMDGRGSTAHASGSAPGKRPRQFQRNKANARIADLEERAETTESKNTERTAKALKRAEVEHVLKISELHSDIQGLKEDKAGLARTAAERAILIATLEDTITELQKEIGGYKKSASKHAQDLQTASEIMTDAVEERDALKSEVMELREYKSGQETNASHGASLLEEANNTIWSLKDSFEQRRAEQVNLDAANEATIQNLKNEVSEARKEKEEALEGQHLVSEQILELEKTLKLTQLHVSNVEAQRDELSKELEKLRSTNTKLSDRVKEAQEERVQIDLTHQEELRVANAKTAEVEERRTSVEGKLTQVEEKLAHAQETLIEAEERLSVVQSAKDALETATISTDASMRSLQARIEEADHLGQQLGIDKTLAETEVRRLQDLGDQLQAECQRLLDAKDGDIESLKNIAEERFQEKLVENDLLHNRNESLLEKIAELEDASNSFEKEAWTDDALKQAETLKSSLNAEQQKVSTLEAALQHRSEEVEELREENSVFGRQNDRLLQEVKRYQDRLDQYDEEFEVQNGLLLQTQEDRDAAEAQAKQEIEDRAILFKEVQKAWAELAEERKKREADMGDYTFTLNLREASLETANSTLADVRAKLDKMESNFKEEHEMNSRIEQRIYHLDAQIEHAQEQLADARDGRKRYKKRVDDLEIELEAKASKTKVAQELITKLQDEAKGLEDRLLQSDEDLRAALAALSNAQADAKGSQLAISKEQGDKKQYQEENDKLRDSFHALSAKLALSEATCNVAQSAQLQLSKELAINASKIDDLEVGRFPLFAYVF